MCTKKKRRIAEKKLEKAVRDYSKGFAGRTDEELALAMANTLTPELVQSEKDETKNGYGNLCKRD